MAIVNLVYNSFPTEIIVIFCFVFKPFNILRSPHQQQINQKKNRFKTQLRQQHLLKSNSSASWPIGNAQLHCFTLTHRPTTDHVGQQRIVCVCAQRLCIISSCIANISSCIANNTASLLSLHPPFLRLNPPGGLYIFFYFIPCTSSKISVGTNMDQRSIDIFLYWPHICTKIIIERRYLLSIL